jgi:hypothetical protein
MIATRALRLSAVAVAIAGAVDPVWSRSLAVPRPLQISIIDRPTLALPDGAAIRRDRAFTSAARLRELLAGDYDVTVTTVAGMRRSACPADGGCVVIADAAFENRIPDTAVVVGGVALESIVKPNVAITRIELPLTAGLHAAAMLRVHLRGSGVEGESRIDVSDGGVHVGSAKQVWTKDLLERDIVVPVTWLPLAEGIRHLRVSVSEMTGEQTLADNTADVAAQVTADRTAVLLYEPEPSWMGTFIRRTIEDDSRFDLRGGTRVTPSIAVTRRGAPALTETTLATVRVAVITAASRLTERDTSLLDHFIRVGGGTVLFLFDERPTGAVARLLPPTAGERQLNAPQSIGPLRGTEAIIFDARVPGVSTIATLEGQAVIVSRSLGRGQAVASGALDAWRFREDDRFARFWTSLVSDAALAAGPAVEVRVAPEVIVPGTSARVTARWRTIDPRITEVSARARLLCGSDSDSFRLWPAGTPGVLTGTIETESEGQCQVEVEFEGDDTVRASTPILVTSAVRPIVEEQPGVDRTLALYSATVVRPGDEVTLADAVRARLSRERRLQETRPLRSIWWLVPFCGCLAGEWWLRRRAGQR